MKAIKTLETALDTIETAIRQPAANDHLLAKAAGLVQALALASIAQTLVEMQEEGLKANVNASVHRRKSQ